MKVHNFRGDGTYMSARKEALVVVADVVVAVAYLDICDMTWLDAQQCATYLIVSHEVGHCTC